jgi:hypothetical protein
MAKPVTNLSNPDGFGAGADEQMAYKESGENPIAETAEMGDTDQRSLCLCHQRANPAGRENEQRFRESATPVNHFVATRRGGS